MPTEATDVRDVIPPDAGLPMGGRLSDEPPGEPRTGDELIAAAAAGKALQVEEQQDLLDYFLANGELPGDNEPHEIEWTVGSGRRAKKNVWKVRAIEWEEWQHSIEATTDSKTGDRDAFATAAHIVGRALVEPKLGPMLARLQQEQGEKAPADAAVLLKRMFRRQSGVLFELSGAILTLSKLQNDNESVRTLDQEVEAGKP